jgi:hypothetical protein
MLYVWIDFFGLQLGGFGTNMFCFRFFVSNGRMDGRLQDGNLAGVVNRKRGEEQKEKFNIKVNFEEGFKRESETNKKENGERKRMSQNAKLKFEIEFNSF